MKKLSILLLLAVLYGMASAQVSFEWAKSVGGADSDFGEDIATDASGNSYVTGYFRATATFGTTTLTALGTGDIFIAKLDPAGNWLWAKRAGGTSSYDDMGYGISLDNDGNCYVTGNFYGTASFGATNLVSGGYDDIFVAKLDSNGNWLWAVRVGVEYSDKGLDIHTDGSGSSYVTGQFAGSVYFGTTLLSSGNQYYYTNAFVAKLSSEGIWLWAANVPSTTDYGNYGYGVSADGAGNSYVTGYFAGTATLGTSTIVSSGIYDLFVAKLSPSGSWLWAKRAGGNTSTIYHDYGNDISTDSEGNSFVTGIVYGNGTYDATAYTVRGLDDVFIAKLDTSGNWLWVRLAGSNAYDRGYGIARASNGNCVVTGRFQNTAYFGTITLGLSGANGSDIFVASLDTNGTWLWARKAGASSYIFEYGSGISTDTSENIYVTGNYGGAAVFGAIPLTSNGAIDIFATKLSPPRPLTPQNLLISTVGEDIQISWDAVTLDTGGQAVLPTYRIYYCADSPDGEFIFQEEVAITSWTHIGTANQSPGFYHVRAVTP